MTDLQNEISRTPPPGARIRSFTGGEPILYAYGCALLENDTGEYYRYTAVNLETNKSVMLGRRKLPVGIWDVDKLVDRIRHSEIVGAARLEVDRPFNTNITYNKGREILQSIFKKMLPRYGYAVRKEQISLAESIFETIKDRKNILAESEVGTGKTLAYLIPAILAKRGRLNDFWNRSFYPKMSVPDMANMPIVIATSSIALQKAIVADYIPELSRIMLDHGVIKTSLTCALRKGRDHYICDRNLVSQYENESDEAAKQALEELFKPSAPIDLSETAGLSAHVKRQIKVPPRCSEHCPYRDTCRYRHFVKKSSDPKIDIQVVNHNYLIADAIHRSSGKLPLIPNYQTIIVDEAHKLLSAARSMYGAEFMSDDVPKMIGYLSSLKFCMKSSAVSVMKTSKKLLSENERFFDNLEESIAEENVDEAERLCAELDKSATRHLRNIRDIADRLYEQLTSETVMQNHEYRKSQLLWEISRIREQAAAFSLHKDLICWIEQPSDGDISLHSVPKDIDERLFNDFWSRGIPTILTSGTLSASGDFSHIKRTLGLDRLGNRISEVSKPSPFNHRENALLYISENIPFPDNKDMAYIDAVTDEVERLILAAHGHTAVLFTSYNVMGRVHAALSKRNLPFPLMRLERGSSAAIEKFKQSKNGVLFASGALWEGIDIPGDTLSMLIIVKLPFQVPDPIGEYEQTLYNSMFEYKSRVIVPEMLIKLKQGFGRLIRALTDTGVVAILDSRANSTGAYRERILAALPDCNVTNAIKRVWQFFRAVKAPGYFM